MSARSWVEPTTVIVKPPEQLDLTDKELNTEITRILSAKDPMAPHNITRYRWEPGRRRQAGDGDMQFQGVHVQARPFCGADVDTL
eukprot:756777-Hanusia_phi.AAC.1